MIRKLRIRFLKFRMNVYHIRCVLIADAVFRAATVRQKAAITRRRDKMNRKSRHANQARQSGEAGAVSLHYF